MPTESLFVDNFPETSGAFDNIPELSLDDFRVYVFNLISKRLNKSISREILNVNQEIEKKGITEQLMQRLNELHKLSVKYKTKDIDIDIDIKKIYKEKLNKPAGLIFNVPILDEKIGGMNYGSLTTIAGFTSHFKSTLATNVLYYNTYHLGYNLVYISLETPKEDVWYNLISRHSYDIKFSKYPFIPHEKMKKVELSQEEMDYALDVVYEDLKSNSRGKIVVLDESDFKTMSFMEIYTLLEEIDDKLKGNLDGFIVDYIQLFKFADTGADDNRAINAYVSFFRKLTQSFRDGKNKKQLIGIILSQINRTAWKKAVKHNGKYDLTCLADANELERGSHRVITVYTTEEMKMSKEASVQILKNRNGSTLYEPEVVFVEPEAYVFGEEVDAFSNPSASIGGDNLGDLFDDDLGGLI